MNSAVEASLSFVRVRDADQGGQGAPRRSLHVLPVVRVPQRTVEGRRDRDRQRRRLALPHPHHSWLRGTSSRCCDQVLYCTGRMVWMAHRKWKESQQQPSMLPGPAVPGSCLASFHFHPIRPIRFALTAKLEHFFQG